MQYQQLEYQQRVKLGESFLKLPWLTDVFKSDNLVQRVAGCSELEAFVEELHKSETDYFSTQITAIRKYLSGQSLNKVEARDAVVRLSSYRLLDVAIWRHTRQNPPTCEVKAIDCPLFKESALTVLEDWPSLISEAYKSCVQVTERVVSHVPANSDNPFALHTLISDCGRAEGFYAILGNFAKAAYHVQYLLKGFTEFPRDIEKIARDLGFITHHDIATYRAGKVDPTRVQNALYLALMCTPMCLLTQFKVDNNYHAFLNLANSFASLPSAKPDLMMEVDCILWNLIFDAALGKISLYHGLRDALKQATDIVTGVDSNAAQWYRGAKQLTPVPSAFIQTIDDQSPMGATTQSTSILGLNLPSVAQNIKNLQEHRFSLTKPNSSSFSSENDAAHISNPTRMDDTGLEEDQSMDFDNFDDISDLRMVPDMDLDDNTGSTTLFYPPTGGDQRRTHWQEEDMDIDEEWATRIGERDHQTKADRMAGGNRNRGEENEASDVEEGTELDERTKKAVDNEDNNSDMVEGEEQGVGGTSGALVESKNNLRLADVQKADKDHSVNKERKRVRGTSLSSLDSAITDKRMLKKKRKGQKFVLPINNSREEAGEDSDDASNEADEEREDREAEEVEEEQRTKSRDEEAEKALDEDTDSEDDMEEEENGTSSRKSMRLQGKKTGLDGVGPIAAATASFKPKTKRSQKKKESSKTGNQARSSQITPVTNTSTLGSKDSSSDSSSDTDEEIVNLGRRLNLDVEFTDLYSMSTPRVKMELDDPIPSFEKENPMSNEEDDRTKSPVPKVDFPYVIRNQSICQYNLTTGESTTYTPEFHYDAELQLLYDVEIASQLTHVDGRPAYFAPASGRSSIHRMSYEEFRSSGMDVLLEIFRRKHILVYGKPDKGYKFDMESLQDVLGSLEQSCTLQDMSVPVHRDYSVRQREGCALDILNSHRQNGRSLNGLDFRRSFDWEQPKKLETDMVAWTETERLTLCPLSQNFPISDMRWGLAATSGCYSDIHIDSSGFATCIECLAGTKDWFVGIPKEGQDYGAFFDLNTFTGDYSFETINENRFRWEKLTLDSTTLFFQRPGTPHIVFTPEASLVRGRFFYSTSTIRDTIAAYYHDCLHHTIVTNTEHQEASIIILSRILAMYHTHFVCGDKVIHPSHLPDLSTFEGIFDMFSLCSFFEVSNALMKWGRNDAVNMRLRHFLIRSRKRARELVEWISHKYAFRQGMQTLNGKDSIYCPYVAKVAYLVYRYSQLSDEYRQDKVKTASSTLTILKRSLKNLDPVTRLFNANLKKKDIPLTFAWTGPPINVEIRDNMGKFRCSPVEGLNGDDESIGVTIDDIHFEERRYYVSTKQNRGSTKTPAPPSRTVSKGPSKSLTSSEGTTESEEEEDDAMEAEE